MNPLRSWLKEERRSESRGSRRKTVVLGLLVVLPVAGLLILRRTFDLTQGLVEQGQFVQAQIAEASGALSKTAADWAQSPDRLRLLQARDADRIRRAMRTAKDFPSSDLLFLLQPGRELLIVAGQIQDPAAANADLNACVKAHLSSLPSSGEVRVISCAVKPSRLYLGAITAVHGRQPGVAGEGSLAYLRPLPLIHNRLKPSSNRPGEPLQPLEATPLGWALARSALRELPVLLGLMAALWAVRAAALLDHRRQRLTQVRADRLASQRIRRTSRHLDRLLARLGPASAASKPADTEDEVLVRLLGGSEGTVVEGLDPRGPSDEVDQKLLRLANHYERFLASARTLALFDSLTGLPNRRYFFERLEIESQRARRNGHHFVIMFVDVDKFKVINDSYGHHVGDAALVVVAERMRAASRREDFIARYGGDEFAILMDLSSISSKSEQNLKAEAFQFASRMLGMFDSPVNLAGVTLPISLSVGITVVDPGQADISEAIQNSDAAMYQAKKQMHSRISVFDVSAPSASLDDYGLFADLQSALKRHELTVMLQPILCIPHGIHALEALVRWRHPQRGDISPDLLLGLADRYRLTLPLGIELIEQAIKGYSSVRASMGTEFRLALNISGLLLSHPRMGHRILEILGKQWISPRQVTLEITEQSVMDMGQTTEENLHFLRQAGMELSLDDFGTGHSSLIRLTTLQPNELKIDKAFVSTALSDPNALKVIQLVTDLSARMNLRVVAEGVETREISELLLKLGINHQQGYLFSHARSTGDLIAAGSRAFMFTNA